MCQTSTAGFEFSSICYTILMSLHRKIFFKKYNFLSNCCSCSYWTPSVVREITSIHICKIRPTSCFITRFKICSVRGKKSHHKIQLDEQLTLKMCSDAVIESRVYFIRGYLDETKDTSCLRFSKTQDQQLGILQLIWSKIGLKMFWNIIPRL